MFSWITGPRTVAIEDLKPESAYESTFVEPPETPAHQFAVKAFKHALFGTPAPVETDDAARRVEKKEQPNVIGRKVELQSPMDEAPPLSPSKQPNGILMTPGTMSKSRKTVSFGSQVMDNEGKRGNISRSGIPNDCPGKFPSPWTPGTQLRLDPACDKRPRTKLTEALLDARTTTQPDSEKKPKARDDSDITIDMGAPRSESGRYWKAQYESYAARSEKEIKKIVAKQRLAKKFAMKKDGEVTELATKLDQERKRFKQRERELEEQNKDYEQRFQQTVADNASALIEIAALKARIASLENSMSPTSSELQQHKPLFEIYEDTSRDANKSQVKKDESIELSLHTSSSTASFGKENALLTPRTLRHQKLSGSSIQLNTHSKLDMVKSSQSTKTSHERIQKREHKSSPTRAQPVTAPAPTPTTRKCQTAPSQEDKPLQSPTAMLPSSPLPTGSPDPWMQIDESSIAEQDKLAMPISTGQPYSRPEWNPPPKQHRTSRAVSDLNKTKKVAGRAVTKSSNPPRAQDESSHRLMNIAAASNREETKCTVDTTKSTAGSSIKIDQPPPQQDSDPQVDSVQTSSGYPNDSTQAKSDKVELSNLDRKEQARRRLEERKKKRQTAGT